MLTPTSVVDTVSGLLLLICALGRTWIQALRADVATAFDNAFITPMLDSLAASLALASLDLGVELPLTRIGWNAAAWVI